MALWVCSRPAEKCHPAEVYVAERLSRLSDEWIISWGFRYGTNGSIEPEREGDFVVQSPAGHVCVLEVKSGQLRQFSLTGYWENAGGDNPGEQLDAEWHGVISQLEAAAGGGVTPLVHKALALPGVNFVDGDRFRGQLRRNQLVDRQNLERFEVWWSESVATQPMWIGAADARRIFLAAFAKQVAPKAIRFFINETDSLILRQLETEGSILDLAANNRQLLVQGGCGSGKTFLAVEQARRWAERASGERVLLLCYNIPLAEQLALIVSRRPAERGEIVVMSWEALATKILQTAGIPNTPPSDLSQRSAYYTVDVPGLLLALADDKAIMPDFDALVVDEGQDHDTVLPQELARPDLPGWWTFFLRLLKGGPEANVAVFYDEAQRPRFRTIGGFSVTRLAAAFSQPAYLRLPRTLRYTRPVFEYLEKINFRYGPVAGQMLRPPLEFREGPEVEEHVAPKEQTAQTVAQIAERWVGKGYCRPNDILVLGQRRERANTSLSGLDRLGRFPLCDLSANTPVGSIPYINVHRAKGLDRLGIIVIGLPPLAEMVPAVDLGPIDALFAGASRARQLLAVIGEKTKA